MATQGTLITQLDYFNIQSQIDKILGNGSVDYGYGQTVTSKSDIVKDVSIVKAEDWKIGRAHV